MVPLQTTRAQAPPTPAGLEHQYKYKVTFWHSTFLRLSLLVHISTHLTPAGLEHKYNYKVLSNILLFFISLFVVVDVSTPPTLAALEHKYRYKVLF